MQPPRQPPTIIDAADRSAERVLAAAAHGAIAFVLFGITFWVTLAVTGVIWLYSRRSPEVRFHAEQAGCYQAIVILINIIIIAISGATGGAAIVKLLQGDQDWARSLGIGAVIALACFLLWFFGSILYGIYAAIVVILGRPFKYPIIGNWFQKIERGDR
jgi:uncharacterized membrane protein